MFAAKARIGGHIRQHPDVAFVVQDSARDFLVRAGFHIQRHPRKGAVKGGNHRHARHRVAQPDGNAPCAQRRPAAQQTLCLVLRFGGAFGQIAQFQTQRRRAQLP